MSNSEINHQDLGKESHDKNNSRRSFLKKTAAATLLLAGADLISFSESISSANHENLLKLPWYRRVKRWGQTNITEKDPAQYDISWWRKHWKSTETQGVIINAGGIVAYYPSKVALHRQATYLDGHDLFGELCRAAHEEGLAVFARMDSNRAHEEFYNAHPDWFSVDSAGNPYKAGELYITCINSPYYNEHIPSILTEIVKLYHPEGFTDNSWSGLGRDSICYCGHCKKSFSRKTGRELPIEKNWDGPGYREWIIWSYERRLEVWDLNNKTTRAAGGPDCVWSGMNSGSLSEQSRSFRDFKEICQRADIIMLDSQARSDAGGFQQNANTGKLIHGLLGWEKLVPESMAMYQAGRPTFRLASKPVPEARMWMVEGIAGGIQPWWHYVSAYHEDRRIYHTPAPILKWHKNNEEFLTDRYPVATVGVIWSQKNTDFYGRDESELMVELPLRGITQALIRGRIPYLPVNADHIDRESEKLSLLILPNIGVLTDNQISAIKRFVQGGGGLIATGETSLYNEWGDLRPDYALGNIFGVHIDKDKKTSSKASLREWAGDTYHTYLRLSPEMRINYDGPVNGKEPPVSGKRHSVLNGFNETDILSFGGLLEPLITDTGTEVPMTFIPQFPIYPPETAWMRVPKTDIPGLILNVTGEGSRIAFMPADLDRQYGRYNLPDHGNLLENLVRWAVNGDIPLSVECQGLIDCNIYKQPGNLILHVVNLTSTATWRQPVDQFIPVGPARIRIRLPEGVSGTNLQLLVSEKKISSTRDEGWINFVVDSISDHEVIVIS